MTMGQGCPINMSAKQKINTQSSAEAELVGVNDAMAMTLWVRLFLEAQGFEVTDNIIFQDNQSTVLLAKNGWKSSGKKMQHVEIWCCFITDNIKHGNATIQHCPTGKMRADFFTKPLQGQLFQEHHAFVLGLSPDPMT